MQLHNESPILTIEEDLLGRIPLVEMIANAILAKTQNNHDCYTIGIYGKWGGVLRRQNFCVKYVEKLFVGT